MGMSGTKLAFGMRGRSGQSGLTAAVRLPVWLRRGSRRNVLKFVLERHGGRLRRSPAPLMRDERIENAMAGPPGARLAKESSKASWRVRWD